MSIYDWFVYLCLVTCVVVAVGWLLWAAVWLSLVDVFCIGMAGLGGTQTGKPARGELEDAAK